MPGRPFTTPFHLPIQMPQSLLPLMSIALSPAVSSKVQHKSWGWSTCSLVGRTFPRRRCAVLTTSPTGLMTSTEENNNSAECITRQVNASCPQKSDIGCKDISLEARVWFKEKGERNSAGELKIEAASRTGVKSSFGNTVNSYSSGRWDWTTVVNRTIRFSATVNSCVSGCGTTLLSQPNLVRFRLMYDATSPIKSSEHSADSSIKCVKQEQVPCCLIRT